MSMAATINKAIRSARASLGDLVVGATLQFINQNVYNTTTGSYEPQTTSIPVEVIPDKFTFTEQQAGDYQITDIKLLVLNPDNDLEITTNHTIQYLGQRFNIHKSEPAFIGAYKPVWTVVLRK